MMILRFLLLEDNPVDADVIKVALDDGGIECELLRVETHSNFLTALETDVFDLILADYALLDFNEFSALSIARNKVPEVPFIVVSGSFGEELAIETLRSGATDYVLKQRLGRLVPCVQRALQEAQERRVRQQASSALQETATKYRTLLESIDVGFFANLSQELVGATSIDEIVQTVGKQLNRYLNISICAFVEINEGAEQAVINHDWHQNHVPSLVGVYPLTEFLTKEFMQIAKAGHPLIIRDVASDPRIADSQRYAVLKIGAEMNVPLIRDGEWKFSLTVFHEAPYNWGEDEIELMRELTNRIWAHMEHARAEASLRESRTQLEQQLQKFNAVMSSVPDFIYIFDLSGRFIDANKPLLDLWQKTLPEVQGKNFFELDYPIDLAVKLQNQIQEVIGTRQPIKDETHYTSTFGTGT